MTSANRAWDFIGTDGATARGTAQGSANVLSDDGVPALTCSGGAGGTVTFSNLHGKPAGSTGLRANSSASATSDSRFPLKGGAQMTDKIKVYRYVPTLSSTLYHPFEFRDAADALMFRVGTNGSAGKIIQGALLSSAAVVENQINRWEFTFTIGTTTSNGQILVEVFNDDATTPYASLTSAVANLGLNAISYVELGTGQNVAVDQHFSRLRTGVDALGPYVPIVPNGWQLGSIAM